ncbi:MAG: glycosyltransferase family 9 protein [bacterium]|nr:glycosyltransferase family 9 protein [bacterium]
MQLKIKQRIDNLIGGTLVAIHLLPVRILGKLLRINHRLDKAPNHIIVIKMLGLGSLILAGDALLALKKKYPNTEFILIGGRALKDTAPLLNLFDRIWIIDDESLFAMVKSAMGIVLKCLRLRNKWSFDFEVYSRLTTIFSLYTFSKNRFGFEFEKVNFRNYLNTHNTYFNLFIPTEENYNFMAIDAGAEITERYYLPQKNNGINRSVIVINNTCSDLSIQRKLDSDQLSELINLILLNTAYAVALAGAPNDKLANQLAIDNSQHGGDGRVLNWAGSLGFEAYLEALASKAKAIVTIDSAPLHIAARLGIPMVAIWGPTQAQSLAPLWLRESKLYKEINLKVHCSPCVHHTKELPCKGYNFCIKDIEMTTVFNQLNELLNE